MHPMRCRLHDPLVTAALPYWHHRSPMVSPVHRWIYPRVVSRSFVSMMSQPSVYSFSFLYLTLLSRNYFHPSSHSLSSHACSHARLGLQRAATDLCSPRVRHRLLFDPPLQVVCVQTFCSFINKKRPREKRLITPRKAPLAGVCCKRLPIACVCVCTLLCALCTCSHNCLFHPLKIYTSKPI